MKHIPDIEILGPEDVGEEERRVRADFWPTVKRALRHIPFIEDVVACLLRDARSRDARSRRG
jgi:uncharacterized membrane protein YkvA (DUF1232 family)